MVVVVVLVVAVVAVVVVEVVVVVAAVVVVVLGTAAYRFSIYNYIALNMSTISRRIAADLTATTG